MKNPRQLVIRQDKQSMSDANRRLSAVQRAGTRIPGPQAMVSTHARTHARTHTHTHTQHRQTHTHTHTHTHTTQTDTYTINGTSRQQSRSGCTNTYHTLVDLWIFVAIFFAYVTFAKGLRPKMNIFCAIEQHLVPGIHFFWICTVDTRKRTRFSCSLRWRWHCSERPKWRCGRRSSQ